MRRWFVFEFRN